MVATDTVVGIVGAVLLVAVMAGVFAYEYNTPAAPDTSTDAGQKAAFAHDAKFAALNATEDIDGDGTPNYKDADVDGDGISNANDTEIGTSFKVSGSIPNGAAPNSMDAGSTPFTAGTGVIHVLAFVNYTASPLPVQQFSLQVSLLDGGGKSVANGVATTSGGKTTVKIDTTDVMPGAYQLSVRMNGANAQGGSYDGVIQVHYDSGPAMPGMHM